MSQVSEFNDYLYFPYAGQIDELSQIFGMEEEEETYSEEEVPCFQDNSVSPIRLPRYFPSEDDLVIPTPEYNLGYAISGFPSPSQPTPLLERARQDIQYLNQQYNKPIRVKLNFGSEPVHSWSEDDLQMD